MSIFRNIKNSIYNPAFYSEKKTESGKGAFAYFIKFSLLISLIGTIGASIVLIPLAFKALSTEKIATIVTYYPAELDIKITKGIASTNVKEPYAIVIPEDSISDDIPASKRMKWPKNLLVIDTKTPFSIDLFEKADTFAFLTKDSIVVREESKGKLTVQSLRDIPDVTINRAKITDWADKLRPFLKILIPIAIVGLFIGFFLITVISKLFLLLCSSLITWIVGKIAGSGLSYGGWFKLGLYALTPVIILEVIFILFGVNLAWYVSFLVLLLTLFLNVRLKQPAA